jgi:hypothetical protein
MKIMKNGNRIKKTKRTKRRRNSKKFYNKSQSRSYKNVRGGGHHSHSPPSYIGSIQGKFINSHGQQMFTNPTGGIA